jgi:hypothetical protein
VNLRHAGLATVCKRAAADATTDDSILDLLGATDRGLPSSIASLDLAA